MCALVVKGHGCGRDLSCDKQIKQILSTLEFFFDREHTRFLFLCFGKVKFNDFIRNGPTKTKIVCGRLIHCPT